MNTNHQVALIAAALALQGTDATPETITATAETFRRWLDITDWKHP